MVPSSALSHRFFATFSGEGSPTTIDYRKKAGALLTSAGEPRGVTFLGAHCFGEVNELTMANVPLEIQVRFQPWKSANILLPDSHLRFRRAVEFGRLAANSPTLEFIWLEGFQGFLVLGFLGCSGRVSI